MNVLLIYGGDSCEHDISVITGCLAQGYFDNVYNAYLDENNICYWVPSGYTPRQHKTVKFKEELTFLFGKKQVAVVRNKKIKQILDIDVVVNCCHGRCGEDGAVAGLCELCNLPLAGSGLISSAVAMNKVISKQMLNFYGFPTVEGVELRSDEKNALEKISPLGFPVILKPATLGSSIGIVLVHNAKEFSTGLQESFRYDSSVLCEKALTNFFELNCAAMRSCDGILTSKVDRPYTSNDILTFQDKYLNGEKFVAKREVDRELAAQVKDMTAQIYEKFQFSGVVRIDYLVETKTKRLFVNEINSVPGSLSYGLWQHRYSPKQFGNLLLLQAIEQYKQQNLLVSNYDSGVLQGGVHSKK